MTLKNVLTGVACAALLYVSAGYAQNVSANVKPPKNLDPKKVPMFVTVGFDDNTCPSGIKWFCDFVRDKKNNTKNGNPKTFDGLPVRVTFLNMTAWPNDEYTKSAADGHEIGCHTFSHQEDVTDESGKVVIPKPSWDNDIKWCLDSLAKYCPNSKIYGFRTPRLEYTSETWTVIKKYGFKYDCSIEHTSAGSGFVWPYTLDGGTHSSANVKASPGKIAGLFEVPVQNLGGMTGFDYNYLSVGQYKQYGQNLISEIDSRYSGDRSPLFINAHADFYSEEYIKEQPSEVAKFGCTLEERRKMFEDVITHALSKPDVRIVPIIDILNWMSNPTELDATYITQKGTLVGSKLALMSQINSSSLKINCQKAGNYSLNLFSLNGRQISTLMSGRLVAGENVVTLDAKNLRSGVYIVKLTNGDMNVNESLKMTLTMKY